MLAHVFSLLLKGDNDYNDNVRQMNNTQYTISLPLLLWCVVCKLRSHVLWAKVYLYYTCRLTVQLLAHHL